MDREQSGILESFIDGFGETPWFSNAHEKYPSAVVVEDIVVGWDEWNDQMLRNWLSRSHYLEAKAQRLLSDEDIDSIFKQVGEAIERPLRDRLQSYYDNRERTTENQELNVDLGLWPEIVQRVIQDVSWAAIEELLSDRGLFTDIMSFYKQGRWPCAWDGEYPKGKVVML